MAKKAVSKKKVSKKPVVKKTVKAAKPIGSVTHFYNHIKVAIVKFKKPVSVGTTIAIRGNKTDFEHKIISMQLNHEQIKKAPKGKEVGIKVAKRVREGDSVFEA